LALLRERLEAELDLLITRRNAQTLRQSGDRWLGSIPSKWTLLPLSHLSRYISYGFTNPMPVTDDGPYMVTANDIMDGTVQFESARKTSTEAYRNDLTDKSRPRAGDILITKDGTLGRVAVADGTVMCINQSVALLRVDETKVHVPFLAELLQATTYQSRITFDAGGTTIKHIYISKLVKTPIALPSMAEQKEIASEADSIRQEYRRAVERINYGIRTIREYRSSVISAAVTGQIDVRHYRPQEAAALCQ
jgi:type I restriction enzyme S subunit